MFSLALVMALGHSTPALASADPSAIEAIVTRARTPLASPPIAVPRNRAGAEVPHRLVVKFADDVQARASSGALDLRGPAPRSSLRALEQQHGLRYSPLITLPEARIEAIRERAARRSRIAQPDLLGMLVVESDTGSSLTELARELDALPIVEFVYLQPLEPTPPPDIPPMTPDFVPEQGYLGSNPGVGVETARRFGLMGAGVRVSDCEYDWNLDHEDIPGSEVTIEPGQTPQWPFADDPAGRGQHGIASIGVLKAPHNGFGVDGMTPAATIAVYPEWSLEKPGRRVDAIASAIADSRPGDIVMLEMQSGHFGALGPAELDPAVWTVVAAGVDAGVTVVAAAGNGALDLDSPELAEYRNRGDSGAIIVGAGVPDATHVAAGFSTYGARVDVHGWGYEVFSLGYGDAGMIGGDVNQAYTYFSGTSSATPVVTGVCVLLQQAAKLYTGQPLAPEALRQLLIETGTPHGGTRDIGPLPNLAVALARIIPAENFPPSIEIVDPVDTLTVPETSLTVSIELEASEFVQSVQLRVNGVLQPLKDETPPFVFEEATFPTGTWEIEAEATDLWGTVIVSDPLRLEVGFMAEGASSSSTTGELPTDVGDTQGGTGGGLGNGTGTGAAGMADAPTSGGCGCSTQRDGSSAPWLFLPFAALSLRPRRRD